MVCFHREKSWASLIERLQSKSGEEQKWSTAQNEMWISDFWVMASKPRALSSKTSSTLRYPLNHRLTDDSCLWSVICRSNILNNIPIPIEKIDWKKILTIRLKPRNHGHKLSVLFAKSSQPIIRTNYMYMQIANSSVLQLPAHIVRAWILDRVKTCSSCECGLFTSSLAKNEPQSLSGAWSIRNNNS